jgi:cytoskeleton protein RodZ
MVGPSFHRCYTLGGQVEGMARGNFGERLKRERELREVTLEEITSATRIGPRFLEALENEDWEKLPGGVFNRGFVRSVARYLGLDEESFLAEYDLAHGPIVQITPERNANHFSSRPKWIPFVIFLILLVVVGGLVTGGVYAWRYYTALHAAKPSTSSPGSMLPTASERTAPQQASSPLPSNTSVASAPPVPLDLYVSLSQAARLRILADGKLLVDEELPTGANRHFPANQQFDITADNSSSVLLELNGQAMPPLGAPGASGTMTLSHKDLRPTPSGNAQP